MAVGGLVAVVVFEADVFAIAALPADLLDGSKASEPGIQNSARSWIPVCAQEGASRNDEVKRGWVAGSSSAMKSSSRYFFTGAAITTS
jgi:hypothetical protein